MSKNPYQSPLEESAPAESPNLFGLYTLFYLWCALLVTSAVVFLLANFWGWGEETTQLAAFVADAAAACVVLWLRRSPCR